MTVQDQRQCQVEIAREKPLPFKPSGEVALAVKAAKVAVTTAVAITTVVVDTVATVTAMTEDGGRRDFKHPSLRRIAVT